MSPTVSPAESGAATDTDVEIGTAARGRPRSDDRTVAILDAAVDVMHDIGWDGFTMQEVANRAGAGLATIYRRWETKEDLVAAAMRHDIDFADPGQVDGAPREVLANLLAELGEKMCGTGGSVISVLAAARDHEAMRCALDEAIRDRVRTGIRDLVGAMIGDDHPCVLTLTDSILGALIFRAGMLEIDTPGDEFAAEMLALIDAVAT